MTCAHTCEHSLSLRTLWYAVCVVGYVERRYIPVTPIPHFGKSYISDHHFNWSLNIAMLSSSHESKVRMLIVRNTYTVLKINRYSVR